ncbi:MAG: hypothetical protein C4336_04045, partial [Armatimonadota bacterium]
YGRFTPTDTGLVASALRGFSLGLFAWSGQALIARAYFAMRDSLTPVWIGSAATALFVPLCFLFLHGLAMGHSGLALATSVSAVVQMVWMLGVLRRRLPRDSGQDSTPFVRPVVLSGLSAVVMAGVGWWVHGLAWCGMSALGWQVNLSALVVLGLTTGVVMVGYLTMCRWLGVPEVAYVRRVLSRQRG